MFDDVKQFLAEREHLSADSSDINYKMEFTRDRELIEKYKQLRQELYVADPRFKGFRELGESYVENCEDPDNQMLIIHDGYNVYGGATLRISTPKNPVMLYLEQDVTPPKGKFYFSLKDDLPELELDKYACAENDEMVLRPFLRKGNYVKMLCQAMLERCIDYRVRYMFCVTDKIRARLYSQIWYNLNAKMCIHKGIDIPLRPEYENIKRHVLFSDMKNFHAVPEDPEATCLLNPLENYEFS